MPPPLHKLKSSQKFQCWLVNYLLTTALQWHCKGRVEFNYYDFGEEQLFQEIVMCIVNHYTVLHSNQHTN